MWDLLQEYKEEMFGCTNTIGGGVDGEGNRNNRNNLLMPCDKIPGDELRLRYRQDPHVSFVVKAISALTAAFRLVQLEQGCYENSIKNTHLHFTPKSKYREMKCKQVIDHTRLKVQSI